MCAWRKDSKGAVFLRLKGPHMATLVTTQLCCQAKPTLVRFIFTVSFWRKGSGNAEVRLSVDILIHLLVCCSFTFTYFMISTRYTNKLIDKWFLKTETNWEFLFSSGWINRAFKLKYKCQETNNYAISLWQWYYK